MTSCWLNQHVDMIRHYHERVELVAFTIKKSQGMRDNFRRSSITQKATSVFAVKPVLPFFDEATNMFALSFPVPRLRMKFEPVFLLLPPLLKKCLWNGVSETKGGKVCRLRLFTMWQIASTLHHLAMRVEAVECDCASRMLARRNRLEARVTRRLLTNHR